MPVPLSLGPRILIEGHNLTLSSGTGIATYARVLADTAAYLGYRSDVLVGTPRGLDRKDPTLSEVGFFDYTRKPTLLQRAGLEVRKLTGAPFGMQPFALRCSGEVVGAVAEGLSRFENIQAVPHLLDVERFHFKRYRKRLQLKIDKTPDLFHVTRPAPLAVKGCPNIYTVHDLVPLRLPYTTKDDKHYHLTMIRELCRRADHIVTVSEFSRQDIIKLTGMDGARITNTYQSVHIPEHLLARPESQVAHDLEINHQLGYKDYFVFVGAIEPKKNLSRLIDAYVASGSRKPLVIVGGLGWLYENDLEKIASDQFVSYHVKGRTITPRRRVRRLSYVPFYQLISLIRGARALLFPSLYEGFGLPMLEAMVLGTPVMTSNVSSLPEIAGDAAALVDPYDVESMADAIARLDADEDWCRELSRRGRQRAEAFAPDAYAARISDLYTRLIT